MDLQTYLSNFSERVKQYPKNKDECVRVRDAMIVHTRGVEPKTLLEVKRPNEPEKVRKYRLANYRPITKYGINNAIDSVYRTLISSNGDIIFSPTIAEYLTEKKFKLFESDSENYSFLDLWFQYWLRIMFDDANGYFGFFPVNSENPNDLPKNNPANQKIELIAIWVDCDRVLHASKEFIAFRAKNQVSVQMEKKVTYEDYFFICTDMEILRMMPFWNGKKIDYRKELYYTLAQDPEDAFPSYPLQIMGGGISMTADNIKYFSSFFSPYVAFGDEAICAFSDNQAVRVRYNFPFVEIKGQVCVSCKGTGKEKDRDGKTVACGNCRGLTVTPSFSPHDEYINMPPASGEDSRYAEIPAVRFANADVSILKESSNAWKEFLQYAKDSVNLLHIQQAQSGDAKEIDREEKYDMMYKISQAVYTHIKWSLSIIEAYREPFKTNRKGSVVTPPTSFQLLTEGEMMNEMTTLIDKDAPNIYVSEVAINLAKKVFNGNEKAQKIIEILTVWDVLFGKNAVQISQARASGGVDQTDVIRHAKGFQILKLMSEESGFMEKKISDIILDAESKLNVQKATPLFDSNGSQGGMVGEMDVSVGKLPLALQQLGLALNRAREANNQKLADAIEKKMQELVDVIEV